MKFEVSLLVALAAMGGAESARMHGVDHLRSSAKTVVSGHAEGKGSRVKYTRAVHDTIDSFWETHAKTFGLDAHHVGQLAEHKRVRLTGSTHVVHQQQTVDGYPVLGGDVIFVLDKAGAVLKSRGAPMSSAVQKKVSKEAPISGEAALENAKVRMSHNKADRATVKVSKSEMVWWTPGQAEGTARGTPILVYHIQGSATVAGHKTEKKRVIPVFDCFVDAHTGFVMTYTEPGLIKAAARQSTEKVTAQLHKKRNLKGARQAAKRISARASIAKLTSPAKSSRMHVKSSILKPAASVTNKGKSNKLSVRSVNTESVTVHVYDCEMESECDWGSAKKIYDSSDGLLTSESANVQLAGLNFSLSSLLSLPLHLSVHSLTHPQSIFLAHSILQCTRLPN
jgi:hypothetical protein